MNPVLGEYSWGRRNSLGLVFLICEGWLLWVVAAAAVVVVVAVLVV